MNYSKINPCDIANGTGCRVTVFVSGCTNHCKGCFQPETWDFGYGKPFTKGTESEVLCHLSKPYIKGLTLLGGDPMEPKNQREFLPVIYSVKQRYPDKDIWCYTGFTYEQLKTEGSYCHCEVTDELLSLLDVLVDGKFREELKDPSLWFRGSSNQRIIDLKKTEANNAIVLLENRDRKEKHHDREQSC